MKKFISLLLALTLCLGLAACGASEPAPAPAAPVTDAPAAPAATEAPVAAETEAPTEPVNPYENLTLQQAEDYYAAVANGQVTGTVADFLKGQDEATAKLYLDVFANIFGDSLLEAIQSLEGRELDQIMAEAAYMVSQAQEAPAQEQPADMDSVMVNDEGMPITMTLYSGDLNRTIRIQLNGENAFMEPDWAMMMDFDENYFLHIPSNYEIYTLQYGALSESTEDLISRFVARRLNEGKDVTVSEITYFNAGGYQWEVFTLAYEQTTVGIDKETEQEVELTSTVYNTTCFARLSSDSALQLVTGNSVRDDIAQFYQDVVTSSIATIDAGAGVG